MQDTNKYTVYKALTAVGRWLLFAIVSFLILFPVLWIFVSSITPPGELFKMPIDYIPDHPTLESYKFLIENVGLFDKIGNILASLSNIRQMHKNVSAEVSIRGH